MPDPIPGLKVGLEIHQQLGYADSRKLFCRCPAIMVDRQPDITVRRNLRAAAGETGTVDIAAAAEQAKQKSFVYHAFHDCTCLVEIDEEPPHPADPESIATAVSVAHALGSTILPTVQFMRKTIVDGSAVSGFQRTGMLAIGGTVPGTDVRVQTVCVEEDAAKIITRTPDEDTYNLSRLGIPLIEISTEPDITTPEQAQEVAAQIGMLLRSTRRVKRGLGTIRQDLNVSIPAGTRVEVKGCQDLRMIPQIIRWEASRQAALARIAATNAAFAVDTPQDITALCAAATGFLRKALQGGQHAIGAKVVHAQGVFGTELCPNYRVGTELADLARSWGFGGIIHSDEDLAKYGIADAREPLRDALGCDDRDGFLIVVGAAPRAEMFLRDAIAPRIAQLGKGVPKEVRKANPDGTTSFLRPLSGGARMYPETDIPLVTVDRDHIIPITLLEDQIAQLAATTGLSKDLARTMVERDIPILDYLAQYPAIGAGMLSNCLLEWPTEIGTRLQVALPDMTPYVEPLLPKLAVGTIAASTIKSILEDIAAKLKLGEQVPPEEAVRILDRYTKLSDADLRAIVKEVIAKHKGQSRGALMGLIMERIRGRADGKAVMTLLQEMT